MEEKKKKSPIIYLIAILIMVACFAGGFFVGKLIKDSTKKENNTENNKNVDNTSVNYTITKSEVEEFLNKYGDYLYILQNNEYDEGQIFYYTISYLAQNNMYTKTGDIFHFKESDIKDLVRILYMRDTIKYGTEGLAANYDKENKTVSMSIYIDLLNEDPGPEKTVTKSIKDFKYNDGIAELTYNITNKFNEVVHDQNNQVISETSTDYLIKLYKVDNELRIKEVSING